jgi:hypothetical protein
MSDDSVQVPPDSSGKKIDCSKINVSGVDVERQRCVVGDDTDALGLAKVTNAKPATNSYGLVTRPIPGDPQPVYLAPNATPLSEIVINFNGAGDTAIINGLAAKTIKIWKLIFQVNGNCAVTIKSHLTALTGPMSLAQGGGLTLQRDSDAWFTCGVAEEFALNLDVAAQVSGRAYYTQD